MNPTLTVDELFEAQAASLKLRWLAGKRPRAPAGTGRRRIPGHGAGRLPQLRPSEPGADHRFAARSDYLRKLAAAERAAAIERLFSCDTTTLVVVANDESADDDLLGGRRRGRRCRCFATPLGQPAHHRPPAALSRPAPGARAPRCTACSWKSWASGC
ncbi:MAG: hypothetical protein MZW92_09635 [Comamonadaceae bacterium]|nr:hypothetical protein [Comamonadaceae bacterium]